MTGSGVLVIDASVVIAIARNEPDGPGAADLIDRSTRGGRRTVVPSHLWLEATNALMRRHHWDGRSVIEAIREIDALDLETIELDRPTLLLAVDLCERHGLTSYDATYLALADATDGSLFTLDRHLRTVAANRAVPFDGHGLAETPAVYEHEVTWPDYKGASAYLARLRHEARASAGTGRLPST
jgi:predicted nucleic acid-binding protein